MNVTKEFRNDLLKRKEVSLSADYSENPGLVKVMEDVSNQLKVSKEIVVIKKLSNAFGTNNFSVDVFVYDTLEGKNKIEPKKKEKKK